MLRNFKKLKKYLKMYLYERKFFNIVFMVLILLLALFVILPMSLLNQIIVSTTIIIVILVLFKRKTEHVKLFIIFASMFISLRYFFWRTFNTINTDNIFNLSASVLLYLAETYSIIIALLGSFIALRLLERKSIKISPEEPPPKSLPTVDIFIPTYDEPVDVVKATALAALSMDYPKDKFKVFILDDGGTEEKLNDPDPVKRENARKRAESLKKLVKEVNANLYYLTRKKNIGAKAGNLNEALKKTNGDLILVLDCDHIPTQDFLRRTVGFFLKYPKLFLVQTPHSFQNPDPIEKNLQIFRQVPNENDMFYKYIQKGLDFWACSFFCGSAALLRRKYLEEVGGIQGSTVTEDAETAIELHSRGYDSAYYGRQMVFGLQPETFSSFIVQRSRWAQGMIQIFLMKNPLKKKGLKWYQKLGYLNSSFFWFFGIARTIFLFAPGFYLFFGLKIYDASVMEVIAYAIPHFVASILLSNYLYARVRWNFFSELYEALQSLFILPAIISVIINPKKPTFKVTPKREEINKDFLSPFYKPIYILFNITLLSFLFAIYRWIKFPDERGTVIIVVIWQILNFLVLALGIIVMKERAEKRRAHRIPAMDEAFIYVNDKTFFGRIRDISLTGIWIESLQNLKDYLHEIRDNVLKIVIKDVRGLTFNLRIKVVNANEKNIRGTFLEHYDDIESFRKLVEIVYSQSTRWEFFIPEREMSPIKSFIFLTKIAVSRFKDAYIDATKEFTREVLSFLKRFAVSLKRLKITNLTLGVNRR